MHLRPGLMVLQRGETEIQLGLDPRWTLRIGSLRRDQLDWLLRLNSSAAQEAIAGLDLSLRGMLIEAGALLPGPAPASSTPTVQAWSHLQHDGDAATMISARGNRTVGILGLGKTGLRIAQCLAEAGVGCLVLDDQHAVSSSDLSPGGYRAADLNRPRRERAAHHLGTGSSTGACRVVTQTLPSEPEALDAVVMIVHGALDPARTWRLATARIPHVPVIWTEASVSTGPLILPGQPPCLRCLDLTRRDDDAAWPLLAAQLASRGGRTTEESLLSALIAPLAAGQLLTALDRRTPRYAGATIEVSLPDAVPELREWDAHPECGCSVPLPAPAFEPEQREHQS